MGSACLLPGVLLIKALIVDDEALVRSGLWAIIEAASDLEVIGEAADGREAIAVARQLDPDVVLMDIQMPVQDGIATTSRLTRSDLGRSRGRPCAHAGPSGRVRLVVAGVRGKRNSMTASIRGHARLV